MQRETTALFKCKTLRGFYLLCAIKKIYKGGAYEALEIIHVVAECAYNNLTSEADLSLQTQTLEISSFSKKVHFTNYFPAG